MLELTPVCVNCNRNISRTSDLHPWYHIDDGKERCDGQLFIGPASTQPLSERALPDDPTDILLEGITYMIEVMNELAKVVRHL